MTVRTADLGGTDFSDEAVASADLNDTFGAVTIHRKEVIDATEYTHSGDSSYTSKKQITLTHPADSLLLGLTFKCNLKGESATYDYNVKVVITGTTLGTKYLAYSYLAEASGNTRSAAYISDIDKYLFLTQNNSYSEFAVSIAPGLVLPDTSTQFDVQIRTANSTPLVYIDEIEFIATYVEVYKED